MVTDNMLPGQVPFGTSVRRRAHEIESWLCVGLDPDPSHLPDHVPPTPAGFLHFCSRIIETTAGAAVSFKINFAFFEALGADGWRVLREVRQAIPAEIPVIADAKRGDIGNSSRAYAEAILGVLEFDAVTVNPYLGWDSLMPFLENPGKGVLVLCKTSNPGSADLQNLTVEGEPLYLKVARQAVALNVPADVGLVVGATHPEALRAVRAVAPASLLLVPGAGAQGGSLTEAIHAAVDGEGGGVLLAISRQILYASTSSNFAPAAAARARELAAETWGVPGNRVSGPVLAPPTEVVWGAHPVEETDADC